jgi:hypothetical protein
MLAPALHLDPLPIRKAMVAIRPPVVALGPILVLCLFVAAGLIWLVIGGAVMQGAPAPRTKPLLQRRLADLQPVVTD